MHLNKTASSILVLALMNATVGICVASPTYSVGASASQGAKGVWTVGVTGNITWGGSDSTKGKAGSSPTNTSGSAETCLGAAQIAINNETALVTAVINSSSLTTAAQQTLAQQEQAAIDNILKPCE